MLKPHKIIRQQFLDDIPDERVRAIIEPQLSAIPELEDNYFEYIKGESDYYEIYKRWILDQSPYPFPEDSRWQYLRTGVLGFVDHIEPAEGQPVKIKINNPLLFLLLDMLSPFLDRLVELNLRYLEMSADHKDGTDKEKEFQDHIDSAVFEAAISALIVCGEKDITAEGYPSFVTGFLDKFKLFFAQEIGFQHTEFSGDNKFFITELEIEWNRLLEFSDNLYGLEVCSVIGTDSLLRYLQLPFTHKGYSKLTQGKPYREIMNYIVALATFKPTPDRRVKIYLRQELVKLFIPLVDKMVKRVAKQNSHNFSHDQIQQIIKDELFILTSDFDFFFATTNNLQKGKISPFEIITLPLGNNLAKLGHLAAADEYPFTDYITKKLEQKIRLYFGEVNKMDDNNLSLDEVIHTDSEGNEITRLDTIKEIKEETALYYPDYDALDHEGNHIGWKIKTFGGLVNKSVDALRRWDRQGYLKPQRYKIYSPTHRKQISYRAYTQDQINKAKQVDILMQKQMRHKV